MSIDRGYRSYAAEPVWPGVQDVRGNCTQDGTRQEDDTHVGCAEFNSKNDGHINLSPAVTQGHYSDPIIDKYF